MNREEIKKNLIELSIDIFRDAGINTDLIEYVDFVEDLGMDSITFITLIVEIEATFDITVPDDLLLMDHFRNVEAVVQVIEEQLTNKTIIDKENCDDET